MKERLQKIMARANLGSRRASEELIEQKRVRVNGVIAQLGDKADPAIDMIEVDGVKITFNDQRKIYVALNKPLNVLTTNLANHKDRRQTVRELIAMEGHLFSIGRLDAESEGLIVMTNDGELVQRLTHPKYRHTKTYKVTVYGLPSIETLERWRNGIFLQDEDGTTYKTAPCSVEIVKGDREATILRVVMTEGRKRQIRRVASSLGHPIQRLVRTHIGKLEIGTLRPGEWRELTGKEVNALSMPSDELETIVERKKEINKRRYSEQRDDSPRGERPFRPAGRNQPMIGGNKPRRPRSGDENRDDDRPRSRNARPSSGGYSRDDGDKPRRPRRDDERGDRRSTDDRPRRPRSIDDRSQSSDRPRRPRTDESSPFDRPRRDNDDRSERRSTGDRPRRPRPAASEQRSSDDRPRRPRSDSSRDEDRPRRPRRDDEGGARRSADDRPRRPRPASNERDTNWGDRPPRAHRDFESDERPRRSADDRPRRPSSGDYEDRPRRPRSEDSERRSSDDRPRRPHSGDSPRDEDRPRRPRPASGEQRPPRSGSDRPSPPRSDDEGDRPRRPRRDNDDRGDNNRSSDRPRRPSGSRPASGGPSKPRRPRRDGDDNRGGRSGDDKPRRPRKPRPQ
jgi:23S rRNA pseudouridine2605 synthase